MAVTLNNYILNFSDPLNGSILLQPFTANGTVFPTVSSPLDSRAVSAATSLLFVGKGTGDYGERVEENLLHLLENFSGASEPTNPVAGQLWYSQRTYWHDTILDDWYEWNEATSMWNAITVINSPTQPVSQPDGTFWYDATTLRRLTILSDPSTSSDLELWIPRLVKSEITGPQPASVPEKVLFVHDGTSFIPSNLPLVAEEEPVAPVEGFLWFDTAVPQLKVYDGAAFISVADDYLRLDGTVPMSGTIDMGGFSITNLDISVPTNASDVATKNYVDSVVLGGIGTLTTDDIGNNSTVPGVLATDALNALFRIDGAVPMTGALDFGGFKGVNALDPTNLQDVATKAYVDSQVSGGSGDGYVSSGSFDGSTGELTLVLTGGPPNVVIPGFTFNPHVHDALDVTFTSTATLTSINVADALDELDTIKAPKDSPTFTTGVFVDTGAPLILGNTTPSIGEEAVSKDYVDSRQQNVPRLVDDLGGTSFSTPNYTTGFNNLWVFLQGVKQLISTRGFQDAQLLSAVLASTSTGLSTLNTYDFDISIDGAPNITVTVIGNNAQNYGDLVTEINSNVSFAAVGHVALVQGAFRFFSNTYGALGTVNITQGPIVAAFDLFAGLTDFISLDTPVAGTDGAYEEAGEYGSQNGSITTTSVIPAAAVMEFLIV